jgi:hypothetical protein
MKFRLSPIDRDLYGVYVNDVKTGVIHKPSGVKWEYFTTRDLNVLLTDDSFHSLVQRAKNHYNE